jgi:transposase
VKEREKWRKNQEEVDVSNTYWLDESSINCGMTRLYGRALSGERVNDYVPDVRFERTSIMGVLGLKGIIAPLTYKGTLDGRLFGIYIEKMLAPALKKGDTLILDNLSSHKVKKTLKPLEDKGVNVIFLPAYSPDFNPIELVWSKIKAYLRKVKARTADNLISAIADALCTITQNDIEGWIRHCGYGL